MQPSTLPARSGPTTALRLLGFFVLLSASSAGIPEASATSAATPGKTYFFATRQACAASGVFNARECAAAFDNARLQLLDRAPRFDTSGACRLRFHLCEITRDETQDGDAMAYAQADAPSYVPTAIGVEMIATPKGAAGAPTLAIDTPARIFAYAPVSRVYEPQRPQDGELAERAPENPAILSADRFEPFSKRKPVYGAITFTASALGAIEGATHEPDPETPEQRRARLKSAPFVQ